MAIPDNNWVPAAELSIREFNTLRGKLCSVIESMDLPHKQERAAIALIKQHTYDSQETLSQLLSTSVDDKKFRYNGQKIEVEDELQ